jgi:hypothetical protein
MHQASSCEETRRAAIARGRQAVLVVLVVVALHALAASNSQSRNRGRELQINNVRSGEAAHKKLHLC